MRIAAPRTAHLGYARVGTQIQVVSGGGCAQGFGAKVRRAAAFMGMPVGFKKKPRRDKAGGQGLICFDWYIPMSVLCRSVLFATLGVW